MGLISAFRSAASPVVHGQLGPGESCVGWVIRGLPRYGTETCSPLLPETMTLPL